MVKAICFYVEKNAHYHIASGAIEYNSISVSYGSTDEYVYECFTKDLMNYPFNLQSKMFADPYSWKVKESEWGYSHIEHKGCLGFGGEVKKIGPSTFLFLAQNVEFL
ncbi:hypothetical protein ACFTAO_41675 [Paenibacillus rhizoplanae]